MDNMQSALLAGLPGLGLSLPNGAAETMCAFGHALLEKNQVMNLTAITDPEGVLVKHLMDSGKAPFPGQPDPSHPSRLPAKTGH